MSVSSDFPEEVERRMVDHMNEDHADALLAYARHFGERPKAASARLLSMDRKEMRLAVDGGEEVAIPFIEELGKAGDARRVMVEMARQAREALGE